ncbi:IS110 family transposase [Bradyrhizobium sp. 35]|uniref:IS110 family transposase n=1 Tax=Bradyrhizobium sp. 35 TaxID=2782670 RepID=UPI001FF805C9|nr:IS110 family transposase [Bradyrhizobium sp. 35]
MIAEGGDDLSSWRSAKHFTSWLGLAPNNKVSGGRMLSSRTRRAGGRTSAHCCRDRGSYRHRARRLLQATFIAHRQGQGGNRRGRKIAVLFYNALRCGRTMSPRASSYETRHPTRVVNNSHGRAKALRFALEPFEQQVGAAVS